MADIVDSSCFQRLRNIRQTSYAPLYSASIHNRFIHSLGVYYLGKIAFKAFCNSAMEKFPEIIESSKWERDEKIFCLACLLHDVGHAPFSHCGENFYSSVSYKESKTINNLLIDAVGDNRFTDDVDFYRKGGKEAAPHEIMSAVVAIKNFNEHFNTPEEKDFFARCICGYKYREPIADEKAVKNCLVNLLNSSVIDVDKLDYIIRDSYMTGFQSVSIDYYRLLNSLTIIEKNGEKTLAYHKSALSVIENVVYAHDSERKWIQNHPVILYENFLIQHAIRKVDKYFNDDKKLFSYETLTNEGTDFNKKGKIRLLSDEDIIYNIKNVCGDELTDEFFFRGARRHPIWKSEAEYRALFDGKLNEDYLNSLDSMFEKIERYLLNLEKPIINDEVIKRCHDELKKINENTLISEKNKTNLKEGLSNTINWLSLLKNFCNEHNIPFDLVIITAKQFQSGFLKKDIDNILIYFPEYNESKNIKKIMNILSASKTRERYFYLYYKRDENIIDAEALSKCICRKLFL